MRAPTIKATNRAYVKLYERVVAAGLSWEDFADSYQITITPLGSTSRTYKCSIEVRQADGQLAKLARGLPSVIRWHRNVEPDCEVWTEEFADGRPPVYTRI